jgi:hypothetical protein
MTQLAKQNGEVKVSAAVARYWDHAEDETLRDLWGVVPLQNIAERLGRSYGAVQRQARRLKLPKLQSSVTWSTNRKPAQFAAQQLNAVKTTYQPSLPKLKFMGEL